MIAAIRTIKVLVYALTAALSSHIYAVGLYDASYENNLLKIPLIKVGDVVYEVTMIREESAELARIGCAEFCFRLASAQVAKDYASSIYSFYDASTSTATIDNLWFDNRVYKVTLKHAGQMNGSDYFSLVNADQKQGLPVYLTSYENKNNIDIEEPSITWAWETNGSNWGAIKEVTGQKEFLSRPLAFADFFQENLLSAFAMTGVWKNVYPNDNKSFMEDSPSIAYFLRKTSEDRWLDSTNLAMSSSESREVCITPSYVLVADFNSDAKPDALVACTGIDFPLAGIWTDEVKSRQVIIYSSPNNQYSIEELEGVPIHSHQASIVDLNNDGFLDILTVDTPRKPIVLWGERGGRFRRDDSFFPKEMEQKSIYGIEVIPVNGRNLILVAGSVADAFGVEDTGSREYSFGFKIYEYKDQELTLVSDLTADMPTVRATGRKYNSVLDSIYHNGSLYSYVVSTGYSHYAIVKFDLENLSSEVLAEDFLQGSIDGLSANGGTGIIKMTKDRRIKIMIAGCPASDAQDSQKHWFYYSCNWSLPISDE